MYNGSTNMVTVQCAHLTKRKGKGPEEYVNSKYFVAKCGTSLCETDPTALSSLVNIHLSR